MRPGHPAHRQAAASGAPPHDQVRYLTDPFQRVDFAGFAVDAVRFNWAEMWSRGAEPC
jgi:hypothetical protein